MDYVRAEAMGRALTRDGGVLDYGSERFRLLVQVLKALAEGRPVTSADVGRIADALGIDRDDAHAFLRPITEQDAADGIIGVLGLSLGDHPHQFTVNGRRMATWCAEDTLFLPALLGRLATIESPSPLSRETVRLTVGPRGVQAVSPAEAVISYPIVEPDGAALATVEAIWRTCCRQIHFFASREEAERWVGGRGDIVILTPDEGYRIGRLFVSRFLGRDDL